MNISTSEFRALSDKAARVDQYRRDERLLILALAAEVSGGTGPLASDDFLCRMAGMVLDSHRQLAELRASLGIPGQHAAGPQLRVIQGGRR